MQGELTENKYSHGRYPVAITYTAGYYTALTDGLSRPIPFTVNTQASGVARLLLVDASAYVDTQLNIGDNPHLVIGVAEAGALSANLVAVYPYKPATTTISLTD